MTLQWRQLHQQGGAAYEWLSLAGMPHDMRRRASPWSTTGGRFAEHESAFAGQLGRRTGSARERTLTVDALRGMEGDLVDVCETADVSAREFVLWLPDVTTRQVVRAPSRDGSARRS